MSFSKEKKKKKGVKPTVLKNQIMAGHCTDGSKACGLTAVTVQIILLLESILPENWSTEIFSRTAWDRHNCWYVQQLDRCLLDPTGHHRCVVAKFLETCQLARPTNINLVCGTLMEFVESSYFNFNVSKQVEGRANRLNEWALGVQWLVLIKGCLVLAHMHCLQFVVS